MHACVCMRVCMCMRACVCVCTGGDGERKSGCDDKANIANDYQLVNLGIGSTRVLCEHEISK